MPPKGSEKEEEREKKENENESKTIELMRSSTNRLDSTDGSRDDKQLRQVHALQLMRINANNGDDCRGSQGGKECIYNLPVLQGIWQS